MTIAVVAVIAAASCGLLLSACAIKQPFVADLEEDKVIVQGYLLNEDPEIIQAANDGCGIHGRVAHGPLSQRYGDGVFYYLFACKDPANTATTAP